MEFIVMKAFGIRLAFGAITILSGAYAAAVAQREKGDEADQNPWSATVPTLAAEPIAGDAPTLAIAQFAPAPVPGAPVDQQPAFENTYSTDEVAPTWDAPAFDQGTDVQLVQHTDEIAVPNPGFEMPTTSNAHPAPEPGAMEVPTPDWMNAPPADPEPAQQEPIAMPTAVNALRGAAESIENGLRGGFEMPAADAAPESKQPAAMNLADTRPEPLLPEPLLTAEGAQPYATGATLGSFPASQPAYQPPAYQDAPEQAAPSMATAMPPQLPPPTTPQPFAAAPVTPARSSVQPLMASPASMSNRLNSGVNLFEVDPATVYNAPGDRRLDGMQSPSLVIQKQAPAEVQIGKAAPFVIQVRNVGSSEAMDVKVHDRVPSGMRVVDASPAPVQQGDLLVWQLGTMPAGDERTVTMQLVPEAEGELGSVARVTFESAASCRTICTRPELKIVQRAPAQVLVGQQLEIELEVSNPGTGEATGVVLQEDVPVGLAHPKGRQLDNLIGDLAPGEIRRQMLRMQAVEPGRVQNLIRLTSEDGLTAEHMVDIEVIAPKLAVGISGPGRRFLERQATYQVDVANQGTADATNVEITVQLDRGFTFVSTGNQGSYDPSRHTVTWSLPNLPAGVNGSVPLTLLPVEQGSRIMKADAKADLNTIASSEHSVLVEAFAELDFQITNPGGPIEVGSQTSYEIRVTNSGSATDANVTVQLLLPTGLELISSETDSQSDGRGGVVFAPAPQMAPGGEVVHRVQVRGTVPGTHIVKAVVTSEKQRVPVTKEESTLVYADR